jgi:hypothetical protein
MFTAFGLPGCGNSCFVAFSNNGNGGVIVKAGDPAPTCSLSQGTGMVSAVTLESPACASCTAAARVEHVWLTLRSIQIRPSASEGTIAVGWIELAPQLANDPRPIDLKGNSPPVLLVERAIVPAGSYTEVRVEYFTGHLETWKNLPARMFAERPDGIAP